MRKAGSPTISSMKARTCRAQLSKVYTVLGGYALQVTVYVSSLLRYAMTTCAIRVELSRRCSQVSCTLGLACR